MDFHTTEIVGLGLELNKTVCKTEFIVNLRRNDSQKRQKRPKRHILALRFPLGARGASVGGFIDRQQAMFGISKCIYLQTMYKLHSLEISSL